MLHVYLHREPQPQVHLICSWCMRICLRRAAHISANGDANGYDTDTDVDMDIGVNLVYIRAFQPREEQSINKSFQNPK